MPIFPSLAAGGDWIKLQRIDISAVQASLTFSNIPQDYTHLVVTTSLRSTAAFALTNCNLRVNNDTGNNYNYVQCVIREPNVLDVAEAISSTFYGYSGMPGNNAPAYRFSLDHLVCFDYRSTNRHKTFSNVGGLQHSDGANANGFFLSTGVWKSLSAITSLVIYPGDGEIQIGSYAILYGVT